MLRGRQRALVCFYCGSKSAHKAGSTREFRCVSCEAENYLDEYGQITDPPAQPTPRNSDAVRYAHAPTSARSTSPARPSSPALDDVFCATCLKNQGMLQEMLATYLPPEDDPQYEQYLDTYDEYRQKLEQRYPQICSLCAPRARERIKQAAYLAKTDHLRRMMDRTRQHTYENGWRALFTRYLLRLAGVGFTGSTFLQACWHAIAAMTSQSRATTTAADNIPGQSPISQNANATGYASCLVHAYQYHAHGPHCSLLFQDWIPILLLIASLTAWWNPQLLRRYTRRTGTLTHMWEYYSFQLILLFLRAAAFHFLQLPAALLKGESLKGAHLFMALLLLSSMLLSFRIIKLDLRSPISFQLPENAGLPNILPPADGTPKPLAPRQDATSRQPFPIHLLNTASPNPATSNSGPPFQASTPPPEDYNDPDAMDWTPSSKSSFTTFNPPPRATGPSFTSITQLGPSPFRGTLPPAPMPPAHRLRKLPSAQPGTFRKATEIQRSQFSMNSRLGQSAAPSTPARRQRSNDTDYTYDTYDTDATNTDTEDTIDSRTTSRGRRTDMNMAAPKFWPQEDLERKTGLEDIFEEGFSIRDTPNEVARRARQQQSSRQRDPAGTPTQNRERWGGFGERVGEAAQGEGASAAIAVHGWKDVVAVGLVPVVCLGIAIAVIKGGYL